MCPSTELRPEGSPTDSCYSITTATERIKPGYKVTEMLLYPSGWWVSRTKEAATLEKARALIPKSKKCERAGPFQPLDVIEFWI